MKQICLLPLTFLLITLQAKAEFEVLIAPTPQSTEKQFIWRVETGQWYRLERTPNLETLPWSSVTEFMADGPTFVHGKGSGDKGFYRLVRIDKCPPKMGSYYPYDGAYSVPRHSIIHVALTDASGIDTNSIQLSVGALGKFTVTDPELTFTGSNVVFNAAGTPLGAYGEKINIGLQVSDVLSNALVRNWTVELEYPDVTASNLFLFGSPAAVNLGQFLTQTQRKFAEALGHLFSQNPPPPSWNIQTIQSNQLVLSVADAPTLAALQGVLVPGTPIANAAVGRMDEIFYRRIVSVDTVGQTLILNTDVVPFESLFTSYSYTLDEESAIRLQADASGNLIFPAPTANKVTLEVADFDKRINLVNKSWDWSTNEFVVSDPNAKITFDQLDLSILVYADVAGKFVLSTSSSDRAMEFSASLTTEFDAGVLPVLEVDYTARKEASGDIIDKINLLAANPIVISVAGVPIYFDLNFGVAWNAYVAANINATVKGGFTYSKSTTYWADYDYYRSPRFKTGKDVSGPGLETVPITATATGSLGAGISVEPYLELAVGPRIDILGVEASAQAGVRGSLIAHADMELEQNDVAITATVGGSAEWVEGYKLKACLTAGLGWSVDAFYRLDLDAPWPLNSLDMTKSGEKNIGSGELVTPLSECWYIYNVAESSAGMAKTLVPTADLAPYVPAAHQASVLSGHPKADTLQVGAVTVIPQVMVTNGGGIVDTFDGGYTRQWTRDGIPVPGVTGEDLLFENPSGDLGGVYKTVISGPGGFTLESPSIQIVSLPEGAPLESAAGGVPAEAMSTGLLDAEPYGAIGVWKGAEAILLPTASGDVEIYDRNGGSVETLLTGIADLGQIDFGTIAGSNCVVIVGRSPTGDSLQVYEANGPLMSSFPSLGHITSMGMGRDFLVLGTTVGTGTNAVTTCRVVDMGQTNPFAAPLVLKMPTGMGGGVAAYPGTVSVDYNYPFVLVGVPETGETHLYNIAGARAPGQRVVAIKTFGDASGIPQKMGKAVHLADRHVLIKGLGTTNQLYSLESGALVRQWSAPPGTSYYPCGIKNLLLGIGNDGECRLYDIVSNSVRGMSSIEGVAAGSAALNLFSNGNYDLSVARYQSGAERVAVRISLLALLEAMDPESCP